MPDVLMMLIFNDRDAAKHGNAIEDHLGNFADHFFVSCASRGAVGIRRSHLFAETDGEHFLDPAAQRAAKIGVRLDAIKHDYGVRFKRRNAEDDIQALRSGADLLHFHAGLDWDTHGFWGDSVSGQDFRLAFGSGATVAAHSGYKKRPSPRRI